MMTRAIAWAQKGRRTFREKKNKRRTQGKRGRGGERAWADLMPEVLDLIVSKLNLVDCIRFFGVCKRWRSIAPDIWSANKSPCFMMLSPTNDGTCRLVDPSHIKIYTVKIPELIGTQFLFSKDGWLLLSQNHHSVFFFNPITRIRIDLPDLKILSFYVVAFTWLPTSPDCVVFAIYNDVANTVGIRTCRRGENEWTTRIFHNQLIFRISHCNPVYCNGVFYCLGENKNLGTFDPKKNTWTVLTGPRYDRPEDSINFIAETGGDLVQFMFYFPNERVYAFKLIEQPGLDWEEVESLGDQMLFASFPTTFFAAAVETSMRNNIYLFGHRNYFLVYSFGEQCHSLMPFDWKAESFKEFVIKPNRLILSIDYYKRTWIEPHWLRHSPEELKWHG